MGISGQGAMRPAAGGRGGAARAPRGPQNSGLTWARRVKAVRCIAVEAGGARQDGGGERGSDLVQLRQLGTRLCVCCERVGLCC